MKIIELLNAIVEGKITEGTQIKDNKGNIFVFKNNRFVDKNDNFYIFAACVDDEVLNNEVEIIEEKQGRWKPKERETYWYNDTYRETHRGVWLDDDADNWRYTTKNVFKTIQEAEEYFEYKTALLKAEKPFAYGVDNYYIWHEWDTEDTVLRFTNFEQAQGTVYLGNDFGIAQAFLDKWYKQILKYEFGIEE